MRKIDENEKKIYKREKEKKNQEKLLKKRRKFTRTIETYILGIVFYRQSPFVCRIFKSTTHGLSILLFVLQPIFCSAESLYKYA